MRRRCLYGIREEPARRRDRFRACAHVDESRSDEFRAFRCLDAQRGRSCAGFCCQVAGARVVAIDFPVTFCSPSSGRYSGFSGAILASDSRIAHRALERRVVEPVRIDGRDTPAENARDLHVDVVRLACCRDPIDRRPRESADAGIDVHPRVIGPRNAEDLVAQACAPRRMKGRVVWDQVLRIKNFFF